MRKKGGKRRKNMINDKRRGEKEKKEGERGKREKEINKRKNLDKI